jgi:hypothetical protein
MLTAEQKKENQRKSSRKYRQSEKGKEAAKRYQQSEKGKIAKKKYQQSEKGKEVAKRYKQSEKGKRNEMRCLIKKKQQKIMIPFILYLFKIGYKIKKEITIDYSNNGYLVLYHLVDGNKKINIKPKKEKIISYQEIQHKLNSKQW